MNYEDKKPVERTPAFTFFAVGAVIVVLVLSIFNPNAAVKKEQLTISAAMSLKDAFNKLGSTFEKTHPTAKVFFNFGSSGQMAEQIRQGSPADIFASADKDHMDALVAKGLVDEKTIKYFAKNGLVVISSDAGRFHSFDQLAQAERLAIGDPLTVPAGKYAEEALQNAHIYTSMMQEKKLVYAENVRQVLAYVESKNVDAGLVYNTDTRISDKVSICFAVPDNYVSPIVYPIGVLASCKRKPLAQQFIDLVISAEGQKILREEGFLE